MRLALLALAVLLMPADAAKAADGNGRTGQFGSVEVGNWKGSAYANDGMITHCAAGAGYSNGIYLIVSVNVTGTWAIGFYHKAWQLMPGATIQIDLTLDAKRYRVFGTIQAENGMQMVVVNMPSNSDLIASFRYANTMVAVANGNSFTFSLPYTAQLLPALATCVKQALQGDVPAISVSDRARGW